MLSGLCVLNVTPDLVQLQITTAGRPAGGLVFLASFTMLLLRGRVCTRYMLCARYVLLRPLLSPPTSDKSLSVFLPCAGSGHALALQLEPGTRIVEHALLSPADVEVEDLVAAAREGGRRLEWVVRAVQARLGAWAGAADMGAA